MSRHISEVLESVLRQLQPKEDGGSGIATALREDFPVPHAPLSPINHGEMMTSGKLPNGK